MINRMEQASTSLKTNPPMKVSSKMANLMEEEN
jgi:hypothetical protein